MTDSLISNSLWSKVCEELKNIFPSDVFVMWFSDIKCQSVSDDKITLIVPNEFNAIWVENNYLDLIKQNLRLVSVCNFKVELQILESSNCNSATNDLKEEGSSPHKNRFRLGEKRHPLLKKPDELKLTFLNPKNTFKNFVIGTGNQLAHAASIAVANAPGRAYNPLFVYGDTGLGKTT